MPENLPTMGVRAIFDDSQVAAGVKRYNQQVKAATTSSEIFARKATAAGAKIDTAFRVAEASAERFADVMERTSERNRRSIERTIAAAERMRGAIPRYTGALGARLGIGAAAPPVDDERVARLAKRTKEAEEATRNLSDAEGDSADTKKDQMSQMAMQMQMLRRFRWNLVTTIYFVRMLSRVAVAAFRRVGESIEEMAGARGMQALASIYGESLARIVVDLKEFSDGTISTAQAVSVAQRGMLADQGQFAAEYGRLWEAARVASVTAGVDAERAFGAMVQALAEGSGEILDSVAPIYDAERALTRYATQSGRTVDALSEQESAHIILQAIYQRTNELLDAGADKALDVLGPVQNLTRAWSELTGTMGRTAEATGLVEGLTERLQTLSQMFAIAGAYSKVFQYQIGELERIYEEQGIVEYWKALFGFNEELQRGSGIRFAEAMKETASAMVIFDDATASATATTEDFVDAQLEARMKLAELISTGIEQAAQAIERYQQRVDRAERRYAQQLERYFSRYQRDLGRIDRRAQLARDRALRARDKQLQKQMRQNYDRIAEMTARFYMQQRHRAEKHALSMLQNSRIYQYERALLVARGDVLAIEDLDARHVLERLAQEENFRLQQQQAEETFKLQLRYMRQASREQIAALRDALAEQLAEIERRRREERTERTERYNETLIDAERSHGDQLGELKESLDDQLVMIGRNIQRQVEDWREGYDLVTNIIQQAFGPGGNADIIMEGFFARYRDITLRMQQWVSTGIFGRPTPPRGYERYRWGGARQHGGSGIVTEPTVFVAGEAGAEHYSFTPVSPIGGQMTVSWGGPPIEVRGSGEFSDVDLDEFGQTLAQGLVMEMGSILVSFRGQRGY